MLQPRRSLLLPAVLVIVLLAVTGLSGCINFQKVGTGSVSGTVTLVDVNSGTSEPGAGVTVAIQGRTLGATTNSQGLYTFKNLPPGSITLAVDTSIGSKTLPVTIQSGQDLTGANIQIVKGLLFEDSFDGPDLGSWAKSSVNPDSVAVANGELSIGSGNVEASVFLPGKTFSDFVMEFDMKFATAGDWAGVELRKTNPDDNFWTSGYLVYFRPDGAIIMMTNDASGFRVVAETAAPGLTFSEMTRVRIETKGNYIKVAAGDYSVEYTDNSSAPYLTGYIGLHTTNQETHFDNMKIVQNN